MTTVDNYPWFEIASIKAKYVRGTTRYLQRTLSCLGRRMEMICNTVYDDHFYRWHRSLLFSVGRNILWPSIGSPVLTLSKTSRVLDDSVSFETRACDVTANRRRHDPNTTSPARLRLPTTLAVVRRFVPSARDFLSKCLRRRSRAHVTRPYDTRSRASAADRKSRFESASRARASVFTVCVRVFQSNRRFRYRRGRTRVIKITRPIRNHAAKTVLLSLLLSERGRTKQIQCENEPPQRYRARLNDETFRSSR